MPSKAGSSDLIAIASPTLRAVTQLRNDGRRGACSIEPTCILMPQTLHHGCPTSLEADGDRSNAHLDRRSCSNTGSPAPSRSVRVREAFLFDLAEARRLLHSLGRDGVASPGSASQIRRRDVDNPVGRFETTSHDSFRPYDSCRQRSYPHQTLFASSYADVRGSRARVGWQHDGQSLHGKRANMGSAHCRPACNAPAILATDRSAAPRSVALPRRDPAVLGGSIARFRALRSAA